MMVFPGQLGNVSVQLGHPILPLFLNQTHHGLRISSFNSFTILRGRVSYNQSKHAGYKRVVSVSATRQTSSFHDQIREEPFWVSVVKDVIWSARSMFSFLAEQPSQLKYIEWPSFRSTLKTATLSLVLVAVFIVALSSVDSALCYILALVSRKAA